MSYKRKGNKEKEKEKDNSWQVIRNKFHIGHEFRNNSLSGYFFWPQYGIGINIGNYTVYNECGSVLIDPAEVQGTRIVRNLKVKVSQFVNQIAKNIIVVIYKYNKSYGGRPCCDYLPEADEQLFEGNITTYSMLNYQNVLGQTMFAVNDLTEHVICIEDDVILESGDQIRVSMGNMPYFGTINQNAGNPPTYNWVNATVNGTLAVSGTVDGAIAFL